MKDTLNVFGRYFLIMMKHYWVALLFIFTGFILVETGLLFLMTQSGDTVLKNFLDGSFELFLYLGGYIFATLSFSLYSKKHTKLHLLTLPVSNLMRSITVVIIVVPLFYVLYTLLYLALTQIDVSILYHMDFCNYIKLEPFKNFGGDGSMFTFTKVGLYVLLQSLFLVGGAFFHRLGFLKTGLAVVIVFLIVHLLDMSTALYSFDSSFFNCVYVFVSGQYIDKNIATSLTGVTILLKGLFWLVLPFSWYVVWLRIKEMEV